VFARYVLQGILGRGGMGVVWRAHDETLGEDVALKFLPDAVRWDPAAFDNLKVETRRARQLTHPHIVRIHDFVEDAGGAAISMELVDGSTLSELRLARANKIFETADLTPWLPQLGAALDYAHTQARVVHRDLKPSNVMLARDGAIKVTDFGVARSLADSVTRVSMMSAGTLVYMSPQQAMGDEPAPADDVYALGATLYELLTGKPPFHTGDVRLQLFQRKPDGLAARRKMLGATGAEISSAWEKTIAACLAKAPEERPRTVSEIAERLCAPQRTPAKRPRRPTRREILLGTLVLALAGWSGLSPARFHLGSSAPVAAGFPSDATRALAAWNFDGDARDGSGHGLDGESTRAVPAQDRFGRIDRALHFNGNALVDVRDSPQLHWSGADAFTAAVWVR
jgi:serine/threonine protein kinase